LANCGQWEAIVATDGSGSRRRPPVHCIWRKGDPPQPSPPPWLYVVLVEWRNRLRELKRANGLAALAAGTVLVTVYVDPDNGIVRPGMALVLIETEAERALEHMVASGQSPVGTYILCPASELEDIIDVLDAENPGWHRDPSKVDAENWRRMVEGSPKPRRGSD
jgi:hypothetical protein